MTENEQLRQRLGEGSGNAGPVQGGGGEGETGEDEPQGTPDGDLRQSEPGRLGHPQSVVSDIFISANGDSSYHGLTSTLFDGAPVGRHASAQLTDLAVPVELIQKQLMGEAAYQRESEITSPRLYNGKGISPSHRAAGDVELPTRQVGL